MRALGAHMSIAGGCDLALERASAFDMTACQIFTKNASQWRAKPLDEAMVDRFHQQRERTGIGHLVAHDSYLINLASPDDSLRERSIAAFADELERCDALRVPYLVTHPGAHMGSGVSEGAHRVAAAINRIYDDRPTLRTITLLETTAGQGTALGRSFDELADILHQIENQKRVGVCFDTCHVFAAGYDLRDEESYLQTMQAFDETIGLNQLRVFHLNDSKKGLGSRVDRHTHLGDGELGTAAFRFVVNDPRFTEVAGILETPKGDDGEEDRRNMATLWSLVPHRDAIAPST